MEPRAGADWRCQSKYRCEGEHWHGQGQVGGFHCPEDEDEADDVQDTRGDHGAILCRPDNRKTPGCRDHKEQDSRQEETLSGQDTGVQRRDMVFDENVLCRIRDGTDDGKDDPEHDSTDSIVFFLAAFHSACDGSGSSGKRHE